VKIGVMTQAELTAHVQTALKKVGIETVLSGGSCVSVWSRNAYVSDDIDLIVDGFSWRTKIRAAMLELGFAEKNRYFVHPESKWFIEFPSGPLAVGEERPKEIAQRRLRTGTLRLLSPTDCVKDRLTWWIHGRDRQSLEQAVAVAKRAPVDVDELRRWVRGEGRSATAAFEEIAVRLRPQKRRRTSR
jgi:hypothetical protein